MKKITTLAVVFSCASVLAACSILPNQSSEPADKSLPAETDSITPSSPEEKDVRKFYQPILENYKKASGDIEPEELQNLGVNTLVHSVKLYPHVYKDVVYTYRDLDNNGVEELVLAFEMAEGDYMPIDYYTLNGEQTVRLTQGNQLDLIGERMTLFPLEDGKFLYRGSGGATSWGYSLYQLSQNGLALEKITDGATKEELTNSNFLDLKQLKWSRIQDVESVSSHSQSETAQPTKSAMDINAIQKGDFSSVAGTWKNENDHTLVFDRNGLVSDNAYVNLEHAKIENGFLSAGLFPKQPIPEVSLLYFIPKGVVLPEASGYGQETYADASDSTRERLLSTAHPAGQSSANLFYYKVD